MILQEIIDHEKDYSFNDGLRVGVQQEIQQGIQNIIRTCQKSNQTKEKTEGMLLKGMTPRQRRV